MKRWTWILVLAMLLLPAGLAMACPMCKDSIPNSDAQQAVSLPGGFNYSIYYMLAGLFASLGLVTSVVTKGVRSTNERIKLPPRQ